MRPALDPIRAFPFVLALLAACATTPRERAPNVVLILADDLGYQDLGCYGHPTLRTPALDRLAAAGVRLTDFHSGATVCTPSRMALLTGRYPSRVGWTTGVMGYGMRMDEGLSLAAPTLAELFRDAGYATAISGKWHLGNTPAMRPHRRGFDRAAYVPMSNNQTDEFWNGDEVEPEPFVNRMLTRRFTDEALRFVRESADQPFFLYLPFTAPHFPVEPHPDWDGRSALGRYGDVVEELDACVGELLDVLAELGLDEDTLVVFTSDNGPNPGEDASSLPFRGEKWSALEGGTRVPTIVAWPGVTPPGSTNDDLLSALDLLPTLGRAAGVDVPDAGQLDGVDAWGALLGQAQEPPRTELLYWHGQDPAPQAIRVGDWKLFFDGRHALEGSGTRRQTPAQAALLAPARAALPEEGPAPPMLFHLRADPGETIDVSAAHPERVEAMRARAAELFAGIAAVRDAAGPAPLTP